jgi:hypothetical protein
VVPGGRERDQAVLANLYLGLMPVNEPPLVAAPLDGSRVELREAAAVIPLTLFKLLPIVDVLRVDEFLVRLQKVLLYCLGPHQIVTVAGSDMLLTQVMTDAMVLQTLTQVRTTTLRFLSHQFARFSCPRKIHGPRILYMALNIF